MHHERGCPHRGLEMAPHRQCPLKGIPKLQLAWGSSLEVPLILQPFTHEPPSEDPAPGKLKSPFPDNERADRMIQAHRKEEENDFASCLLWGSAQRGRGQQCRGRSVLSASADRSARCKLNAAAPSFRTAGEESPANTPPPLIVCILYKPCFPKAALEENNHFILLYNKCFYWILTHLPNKY